MAQKDQIKWNKKYQDTPSLLEERKPSGKLIQIIKIRKKIQGFCCLLFPVIVERQLQLVA